MAETSFRVAAHLKEQDVSPSPVVDGLVAITDYGHPLPAAI